MHFIVKIPYDWSKLITDEDVRIAYSVDVNNRFQILQEQETDDTANTMYQNIILAHNKSSELHVPLKPKIKKMITMGKQHCD